MGAKPNQEREGGNKAQRLERPKQLQVVRQSSQKDVVVQKKSSRTLYGASCVLDQTGGNQYSNMLGKKDRGLVN